MATLREQQSEFVRRIADLIDFAYFNGYQLTWGDTYPHSKHKIGSFHDKGLAIDLNLFKDGKYLQATEDHKFLGEYWESLNPMCTWGGHFPKPDGNHYSWGEK